MTDLLERLHDPARLSVTRRLAAVDVNAVFDRLAGVAAEVLATPVGLVCLVDADRQLFVGAHGLPDDLAVRRETPVEYSICQHAVAIRRPLVLTDARRHTELADNPAVWELGVVAYAGVPVVTRRGHALGTVCVMDLLPRDWTADQLAFLARLADVALDELRLAHADRLIARRNARTSAAPWAPVRPRVGRL